MQIYIQGNKKSTNEKLAAKKPVFGDEFVMFNCTTHDVTAVPNGTVVKFFDKYVGGSPYAKSYGQVVNKGGIVKIK
jgi:hypothetical protein